MTEIQGIPGGFERTLWYIWMGVMASPLILIVVGWIVLGKSDGAGWSLSDPLLLVFSVAALLLYAAANHAHRFFGARRSPVGTDPSLPLEIEKLLPLFVIRIALFEGIAVLGFALALWKGSIILLVPFAVLSLIGILASKPTERLLRRLAGQAYV